jgi:hypothetical protein
MGAQMRIKKLLAFSLLAICILTIPVLISGCGQKDPTDRPYIKSQSSSMGGVLGTVVSYDVTVVNPTDKTLTVTITVHMSYSTTPLYKDETAQTSKNDISFEIAPKATVNKTASGTFPTDTWHWKHSVSISSYEKLDTGWLVGTWSNANTAYDDIWVFTATSYENSGLDGHYGSGTWAIIYRDTTLRFTQNGVPQPIDKPFSVSDDNNTLHLGGETYIRVG